MNALTAIPLIVEPEAAELVLNLGMQTELELMLEHIRQTIPNLVRLKVVFAPAHDTGSDPSVVIEAHRDADAGQLDERVWDQFSRWQITTFSPDVFRHFTLLLMDGINHGG